jgi:hypothetical protein
MRIDICCVARDELDILEWVAFHRVVGVSHITLYDNQSQIPLKSNLSRYVSEGFVSVIEWPGNGDIQMQAYNDHINRGLPIGGMTAFIDADEFLLPRGESGLSNILSDYCRPGIGGLNVSWQIFGSDGHDRRPAGLVIENYRHIIPHDNYESTHTKAIVRNDYVRAAGSNPHFFVYKNGYKAVGENYEVVHNAWAPHSTEKIVLNHYCVKSKEDWEQKISKPRADTKQFSGKTMDDFYVFDNAATEKDESALRFLQATKAELSRIA